MLKRVQAHLIIDEGCGPASNHLRAIVILNEIFPTHVRLFSQLRFERDQTVTFNIPHIRNFFVKGKIAVCRLMASEMWSIAASQTG